MSIRSKKEGKGKNKKPTVQYPSRFSVIQIDSVYKNGRKRMLASRYSPFSK